MTRPFLPRAAEIARGLGALLVLALLLFALPIGLYAVAGSPIPEHTPTLSQITAALMQRDTDNVLFLGAVRLIGWAAWGLFVLTICAEAAGYLVGRTTPRLPRPVRPLQYIARDLVATVALSFGAAATVTSPSASAHSTAVGTAEHPVPGAPIHSATAEPRPQQHGAKAPGRGARVIKRGDTLWGIARREYGSGTRYPEIFEASRNIPQPPGLPPLTDPGRLHPGQHVHIPRPSPPRTAGPPPTGSRPPRPAPAPNGATASTTPGTPTPSPPSEPAAEASPAPADAPPPSDPDGHEHGLPFAVTLPSGTHIGLGLAAALSVALATTRLHRRRRRPTSWSSTSTPEPTPPEPVATIHKAHLDTYAANDEPIPTDAELVTADRSQPSPDRITLGNRDQCPITLPVPGLRLGLTGESALDVARAISTELLAKASRDRVELVIPEPDVHALFTDISEYAADLPGLTLTPSATAAITHLETEALHRARLLYDTDSADLPSLRTLEPAEPLPRLVFIGSVSETATRVLDTLVQLGHRYDIGAVLLGPWPTATTLHLNHEATITSADGPHAERLTGTRMFRLTRHDADAALRTIRTATATATEPQTVEPPTSRPSTSPIPVPPPRAPDEEQKAAAIQLRLFGPVQLRTTDGPINTGLRRSARALLTYLALHPNGITREQGTTALWPDHDPNAAAALLHTAISNIRKVLRDSTGLREPAFVIHTASRYRLDPDLIDVDLWNLTTTLTQARQANDDAQRAHTLQAVTTLYTADFATDLTHEWAGAHREHLRRTAIDALVHLAQLTQVTNPEQALATLEQTIHHDPYSETLYQHLIRLQAQLGRPDAAHRTYRLLSTRLAELDTEPNDQTHQLMSDLTHT